MENTENRIFKRLRTPITVRYTIPDGTDGESRVNDISLGGICLPLRRKTDLSPGENLMLKIRMPGVSNRETVIFGEVIWVKKPGITTDGEHIAGVKFIKADILDIENLISSLNTGEYFTDHERRLPSE